MNGGRVYRSSAPVNVIRDMGEYYNREAERVMGYRFERPSSKGLVIRRPTPAERVARDTSIEALREERGGVERARAAKARGEAAFAAARSVGLPDGGPPGKFARRGRGSCFAALAAESERKGEG